MSPRRANAPRAASSAARASARTTARLWRPHHEARWVAALIAVHLALTLWAASKNSVTFDENFHLPAGVVEVARRDFGVSPVNPPLVKAACGATALLAGARLPDPAAIATHDQWVVGESFMRRNAARYHRVFFAARMVVALLSCLLALVVWRFARRLYGPPGGMLALAFYAFSCEALAHAGLATLDVATGLAFTSALYAFWLFTRTCRWRHWLLLAAAVGFAALTRFTTVLLAPMFLALAALGTVTHRLKRPRQVWMGIGLLAITTLLALQAGYLGRTSWKPIGGWTFRSALFQSLQHRAPGLRLPLPDDFVAGLDVQAREGQGNTPTFFLGRILTGRVWLYFPIALLAKWPLGFLGALAARLVLAGRRRRRRWHEAFVLLPAAILLLAGVFVLQLNIGIRYLFTLVPLLCVWLGGFAGPSAKIGAAAWRGARRWAIAGAALASLQAAEVLAATPWYLSFFNRAVGGPGAGFWLVNDSNVDWGQGLIALRDELRRRGIRRVNLAYHGTTDPAVYGIDYIPFTGGDPSHESDWIAVSSYFYVGLWQRMTTQTGRSAVPIKIDFRALWGTPPVASPAGCMYLYRVERGP